MNRNEIPESVAINIKIKDDNQDELAPAQARLDLQHKVNMVRIQHRNGNYAVIKDEQVTEAQLGDLKLIKSGKRWIVERHKQQGEFYGSIAADAATGEITMIAKEGYKTIYQKDGRVIILRKDGSSTRQMPDGSKLHFTPEITVSMIEQSNGLKVRFNNGKAYEIQTQRDGRYTLVDGCWIHTHRGTKTKYYGTISINEDGIATILPHVGQLDFSP